MQHEGLAPFDPPCREKDLSLVKTVKAKEPLPHKPRLYQVNPREQPES